MTRFVIIAVLLSILSVSQGYLLSEDVEKHFSAFKAKFRSNYASPEEEARRKSIFTENLKEIDRLNEINGEHVFGINKFSDQSKEEMNSRKGFKVPANSKATPSGLKPKIVKNNPFLKDADVSAVNSVNWANQALNVVTPVKNQGQCGSCWANSAAEQIESQWALEGLDGDFSIGGEIWEFSVQQIASCTTTCYGCGGGWQQDAYEYIMSLTSANEGLGSQYFAPYTQSMVTECSSPSCTRACSQLDVSALTEYSSLTGPFATLSGWDFVTPTCVTDTLASNSNTLVSDCNDQNMTAIQEYLTTSGPMAIVVNAAKWYLYNGGVMTAEACGSSSADSLDHAVQLVGFNNTTATPYWIVRNSWSTDWGMNGYIYLSFPGNTCGLGDSATYVTISNGQDNF